MRLTFVCGHSEAGWAGSVRLRAIQMSEHVRPYLPDNWEVRTLTVSRSWLPFGMRSWIRRNAGGVVVLIKRAAERFGEEGLADLKRYSAAVCMDYVDLSLQRLVHEANVQIASSFAQEKALRALLPNATVRLVHHNVDDAVPTTGKRDPAFSAVYFGGPDKVRLSENARRMVTVLPAGTIKEMSRNAPKLYQYSAHYAVRPLPPTDVARSYGPFTKGFVAAKCGVPVIVNRQADDAVDFLGEHYPYLIDDTSDAAIDEGLQRMRDGFGSAEWRGA